MKETVISGVLSCKAALSKLASTPSKQNTMSHYTRIVEEMYCEIREARGAGHSWNRICLVIEESLRRKITRSSIAIIFRAVDLKYERETGVPALPVRLRTGGPK